MGVGGQHHAPATLPPGKTWYPMYRRLGGPQGRSGQVRKISTPPGFDPRTVQPIASRYTDYAIPVPVGCGNNIKSNITNTKFLGIMIDNTLTWKSHIEMIIPKLSVACFAIRAIKSFVMLDTLNMIYHSYFHSVINYMIISWGNSSCSNSIFKQHKRIFELSWV